MCNPVNLLVLDEPTNHLDLPSCDVLEDALVAYPGTVLLVSHDRHLIRNAVAALVEVRDGQAVQYLDVEEHILTPRQETGSPIGVSSSTSPTKPGDGPRRSDRRKAEKRAEAEARNARSRTTRDQQKMIARLERQASRADEVVAGLSAQLADPETYADPERMRELVEAHGAAEAKAAELLAQWEAAVTAAEGG